ncbi:urease accessory protein [Sporosarcina sp. P13]|uniref:urease accessory protein UreD n=1 Tax=Sporosarcina sp. P13 TaxID=2048263 RepID=UPI000C172F08|nr:urease accessory protein UreD [Sporosarcina sp. P13]PIC62657.1 urease accessory protein [Sporosarcina sp. P13]
MEEWTGLLQLAVADRGGKTVPKSVYFQGAFKVMRPIYHSASGQACYYLLNPGGGYVDGDRYRMDITAEKDSRLTLTTQSATKVYRTPRNHVYQEANFHLKGGSYLEYLPDALIAYQQARYTQKTIIRMDPTATLFYSDILTPGWSPENRHFSYEQLRLVTEIYMDDELVVFDHLKLQPALHTMDALGVMEGYTHVGTILAVREDITQDVINRLHEELITSYDCRIGISRLSTAGFTVRILANQTQVVERVIGQCHRFVSEEWFQEKPSFLRKY